MNASLPIDIEQEIQKLIEDTSYAAAVSVPSGDFVGNLTLSARLTSNVEREEFSFHVDYFEPPLPGKVSRAWAYMMLVAQIGKWAEDRARLKVEAALQKSLEPFKGQPLTDELKPLVQAAMWKAMRKLSDE